MGRTNLTRASKTNIRGIIGIIESGSKKVFGIVELFHCIELDLRLFNEWRSRHRIQYDFKELPYKKSYAWCLTNIKRFDEPIPYEHKQGCVIWVNI